MNLYWDYVNGSTAYPGTSARRPLKTVAQVNAAVVAALAAGPRAQVNLFANSQAGPAWAEGTPLVLNGRVNFLGYGADDARGLFDLRPYKQLVNANFSRPNAGTYPTVWGVADSEVGAGVWEDVGWGGNETPLVAYAPITAANIGAALPLLHATAGTFWTDGTTMYVHPLDGTNPTTDGKVYVRSVIASYATTLGVGVSIAPAVLLTNAGFRVRRLAVGGMAETVDAHNTYGLAIIPTEHGEGEVEDCRVTNCGWHQAGIIALSGGTPITRGYYAIRRMAYPQASDWATVVPFVFYGRSNVAGISLDLDDLDQSQMSQLAGSSAGRTGPFPGAIFSHGEATTGQPAPFSRVSIRNPNCAGGLATFASNQVVTDGGLTVSGGRLGGLVTVGVSATFDGAVLGSMPAPSAAGKTVTARNCVVQPFDRGQAIAQQAAGSTLDFQYGVLDVSDSPDAQQGDNGTIYPYVARGTVSATTTLIIANSVVALTTGPQHGGGCMMLLFSNGYLNTDALRVDFNTYCTRYQWQPQFVANADALQPRVDTNLKVTNGITVSGSVAWGGTQDANSYSVFADPPAAFVPSMAGYLSDYTRRGVALYAVVSNAGPYDSPLSQAADGTPEARLLAKLDAAREAADRAEAAEAWDVDTNVVTVGGGPATLDTATFASAEEIADALTARVPVYVNTKVAGGAIEIIRKDSYKSSQGTGRLLSFVKVVTETYWPDTITTAHFYCKPTQETLDLYPSAVSLTDVSMTVVDGTGSDQQVTLELTSAQTGSLQAGLVNTAGYKFWIIANKDTEPAVLRNGTMTVRPDPTAS
jgi:hypothetical protein